MTRGQAISQEKFLAVYVVDGYCCLPSTEGMSHKSDISERQFQLDDLVDETITPYHVIGLVVVIKGNHRFSPSGFGMDVVV